MNILIIGGSGLVGGNLYKVLAKDPIAHNVISTHRSFHDANTVYFDTSDSIPEYISRYKWDVIIHTGALTNVDLCEDKVDLSYLLTVKSTQVLLDLAKKSNAKFIYLSTDYVFDGKYGPYREDDATSPLNIYGKHKLEAEQLLTDYFNFLIIRITNVYGDEIRNKNFIARILTDLKNNETITVTAPFDQFASPVNAFDVAKAISLLIKDDKRGIYHLSSTDYMSRVQLLQRINVHFKNRIKINSINTSNLKQKALRPLVGGLISFKFMNEYPEFNFSNIDDYIIKKKYE